MDKNYEKLSNLKACRHRVMRTAIYSLIFCLFLVQVVSAAQETIENESGTFIIQGDTIAEVEHVRDAFNEAHTNSQWFRAAAKNAANAAALAGEDGVRIMVNDPTLGDEDLGGSRWQQSKLAVHLANIDASSNALGVDSETMLQSVIMHELSHLFLMVNGDVGGRDNPGGPHVEAENRFLEDVNANFRRLNYIFEEDGECYTDFRVWKNDIGKRMTLKHSDHTAEDTTGDYAACQAPGKTSVGGFVSPVQGEAERSLRPTLVLVVVGMGFLLFCSRLRRV